MGFEHGSKFGKMYTLSRTSAGSWEAPLVQDGVTCTNGMGWSRDGKIMSVIILILSVHSQLMIYAP
jgi:sugar lactone lactonase YvrE